MSGPDERKVHELMKERSKIARRCALPAFPSRGPVCTYLVGDRDNSGVWLTVRINIFCSSASLVRRFLRAHTLHDLPLIYKVDRPEHSAHMNGSPTVAAGTRERQAPG